MHASRFTRGKKLIQGYVHQELDQEITAIGGRYVLVKEVRVPFQGRELFYLVGHAAFDTICCGAGGCTYALVPGFVLNWHNATNEDGFKLSLVEPIIDTADQEKVKRLIGQSEMAHQVVFL